jgi:hypothetical protein
MRPRKSSLSEKPIRQHSRRLVDWLKLAGARKVHSLVDKVYKMKNLGLVNLVSLIPSIAHANQQTFVKAQCGKTARWV